MIHRTAVYGDAVSPSERRRLHALSDRLGECVAWFEQPRLFRPEQRIATVFVDLDNPSFAEAAFLTSLATAGKEIHLIGKANQPDRTRARQISRLGVSEVLTSDECLLRLDQLLSDLEKVAAVRDDTPSRYGLEALIGDSPAISETRAAIKALAEVDFPSALILGPTGTGKGLVAKILHHTGLRRDQHFVEVNCSAIPDELFESELFGHVKGAFTDAKADKMGLFEYAAGGTIFLDEVGNLSASAQAKLLKVLEDKKLRRVGEVGQTDIDVRVLAATNLDLEQAINERRFREDLYFRLSLLTLHLPPLKDRADDIRRMSDYYLNYYSALYRKQGMQLDPTALEIMFEYGWPGNVRELCNVIERAVLLARSKNIDPADIKGSLRNARVGLSERRQIIIDVPSHGIPLDEAEQLIVRQVLDMFRWNKTETARFLEISRPRLRRIMEAGAMEQDRRRR
jgi:two-component system NtrC family response regulator